MRKDKELGALRVMEALSAVDEELLERSGESGAADGAKKTFIYFFVQRYAKVCVACICLVLLGAAYFGVSQIRMGSAGKSDGMSMNGGGTGSNSEPRNAEAAADVKPEEIPGYAADEAAGNSISDSGMSARIEPEWLNLEQLAALPVGTVEQEPVHEEDTKAETPTEKDQVQSAGKPSDSEGAVMQSNPTREEPGAEAVVPERYRPVEPEAVNGEQDSLLYEWSDGEQSLWLRITQTNLTVDLRFEAEPPVYTVQEEWEELIPDAGADGYIQFALLYDNGMLAEYCGALEQEEIIRLMESLAW